MPTTWTAIPKSSATGWTSIAKPPTSSVLVQAGEPIGLLLALTYDSTVVVPFDPWTRVTEPSSTPWTNIPKAT